MIAAPGFPKISEKICSIRFLRRRALKAPGLDYGCRETLVMRHHGTIRFRSSCRAGASGTTFEVFLPIDGHAREESFVRPRVLST